MGLIMIYSWIHAIVIIARKVKDTTQYENAVMIVGAVGMVLFVIGSFMI